MIAYKRTNGRATDLRFVPEDYAPEAGEFMVPGDDLPPLDSLHDPAYALADAKARACAAIDSAAEAARDRYITPGAGQAMTYLRKEAQARAFAAAGYAGTVPALVQAKAAASGLTARQAADLIVATADAWEAKAAQIEQAREAGKGAVSAAVDTAAVTSAREAGLEALGAL